MGVGPSRDTGAAAGRTATFHGPAIDEEQFTLRFTEGFLQRLQQEQQLSTGGPVVRKVVVKTTDDRKAETTAAPPSAADEPGTSADGSESDGGSAASSLSGERMPLSAGQEGGRSHERSARGRKLRPEEVERQVQQARLQGRREAEATLRGEAERARDVENLLMKELEERELASLMRRVMTLKQQTETVKPVARESQEAVESQRQALHACYMSNPGKPLNCAVQVQEFFNTVKEAQKGCAFGFACGPPFDRHELKVSCPAELHLVVSGSAHERCTMDAAGHVSVRKAR